MTKTDKFVLIYTFTWMIIGVIGVFIDGLDHEYSSEYTLLFNSAFLLVSAIMTFCDPVREWINKNIIDKL